MGALSTYRVVRRPVSFKDASGNVVVRSMGDLVPEAPSWPTFRSMLSLNWIEPVVFEDLEPLDHLSCAPCGKTFDSPHGLKIHNARVHK